MVGDAVDAAMYDSDIEPLLDRGNRCRQRHLSVGNLGSHGVANCGASTGRGDEAGDIKAALLEVALLLSDGEGHAVHAGAEVGDR